MGLDGNDEATVFVQWIDNDPLNITSLSVSSKTNSQFIIHIKKVCQYNSNTVGATSGAETVHPSGAQGLIATLSVKSYMYI